MRTNLTVLLVLRFVGIATVAAGGLTIANGEDSSSRAVVGIALVVAGLTLNVVCRRLSRRPLRELAQRADERARSDPPTQD